MQIVRAEYKITGYKQVVCTNKEAFQLLSGEEKYINEARKAVFEALKRTRVANPYLYDEDMEPLDIAVNVTLDDIEGKKELGNIKVRISRKKIRPDRLPNGIILTEQASEELTAQKLGKMGEKLAVLNEMPIRCRFCGSVGGLIFRTALGMDQLPILKIHCPICDQDDEVPIERYHLYRLLWASGIEDREKELWGLYNA